MKKQFIAIVFEGNDHNREVAMYDTADYTGGSDGGWYLISRNRDDVVVLMIPTSRVLYVKLVEDRREI